MAMRRAFKFTLIGALALLAVGAGAATLLRPPPVSPEAIQQSVSRTPELMSRAWAMPTAATFAKTVEFQDNGSLCGPTSLANVFRSLGDTTAATTQGVLARTDYCWTGYCIMGLTLDELAEVARANTNRKVTVLRDLDEGTFRQHLGRVNDPHFRYIVNFTRSAIFGAGAGHHSPIAAYLPEQDMVLVLDVNADFQPWLIEAKRLYTAMNTMDGDHKRGLLMIE